MDRNHWKKLIAHIREHKPDLVGDHYRAWHDYQHALATAYGKYDEYLLGVSWGLLMCGIFILYEGYMSHMSTLIQNITVVNLSISLFLMFIYRRDQLMRRGKAEANFRQFDPRAHLLFPKPFP